MVDNIVETNNYESGIEGDEIIVHNTERFMIGPWFQQNY